MFADAPRLAQRARARLDTLSAQTDTTTNPARLERQIGRAYLIWQRRASIALVVAAAGYERLECRSLHELRLAVILLNPVNGSLRERVRQIKNLADRAMAGELLSRASWHIDAEIRRRENAIRASGPQAGLEPIVRQRQSTRGTHRQHGVNPSRRGKAA